MMMMMMMMNEVKGEKILSLCLALCCCTAFSVSIEKDLVVSSCFFCVMDILCKPMRLEKERKGKKVFC